MAENLGPLSVKERITDSVFERLREAILAGELRAGSRLSVPALAAELGVSRSPVREAVQRLTSERLAYEEPRRGCFVVELEHAELIPVYEVREALEGLAARKAAEEHTPQFRRALSDLMTQHRDAVARGDLEGHVTCDIAFHKMVHEEAANPLLSEILDSLSGIVQLAIRTTSLLRTGPGNIALEEHDRIFAAIMDRDPDAAQQMATAHVHRLSKHLRSQIAEGAAMDNEGTPA